MNIRLAILLAQFIAFKKTIVSFLPLVAAAGAGTGTGTGTGRRGKAQV